MNTARLAVAHRADRLDGVVAVLAGRGEGELAVEASRNASDGFS